MSKIAIDVKKLNKRYGNNVVVEDVSFWVKTGEVFGFLGPNGAGKTTTLEMIEGLRVPNSGEVFIEGRNVQKELSFIKSIIGVQLQASIVDERIRVAEVIELFASYYKRKVDVDNLLALVNLTDKKKSMQKNLSGGQKQRLSFALCIVNNPSIIFLDEPTTGLDPQSRRNLWDLVLQMKEQKKTVVLTTHYMDEAEKLCDRIAIIDRGKIIAVGTPNELIEELDAERIIEVVISQEELPKLDKISSKVRVEYAGGIAEIYTNKLKKCLTELLSIDEKIHLDKLHIRKATLEDVFIRLTGRSLRE